MSSHPCRIRPVGPFRADRATGPPRPDGRGHRPDRRLLHPGTRHAGGDLRRGTTSAAVRRIEDQPAPGRPRDRAERAVPAPGSADLCFVSATPLEQVQEQLAALGVAVEEGPVDRTGALGPIRSVYVRDPDGNLVEISTY